MRENLRLLATKIEAVYATDPVPTAAANSILVRNLKMTELEISYDERSNVKPYFGQDQQIVAWFYGMIEFDVELQYSGTAGTPPKWDVLMRGCGHAVTNVAVTSDTYNPISAAEQSVTHYFYHNGDLFIMVGAKGSVSRSYQNGKAPIAHFKFWGLVSQAGAISTVALPAAVYTGFQIPLAVNKANTQFTLGGYAAVLESFTVDMGHVIGYTNRPNREAVDFTNRKVTGTIVIEKPNLATKDYFAGLKAGSTVAMSLVHGTAAGLRLTESSAILQLQKPSNSESNGITMMNLPFVIVPTTAGNDEITLAGT